MTAASTLAVRVGWRYPAPATRGFSKWSSDSGLRSAHATAPSAEVKAWSSASTSSASPAATTTRSPRDHTAVFESSACDTAPHVGIQSVGGSPGVPKHPDIELTMLLAVHVPAPAGIAMMTACVRPPPPTASATDATGSVGGGGRTQAVIM